MGTVYAARHLRLDVTRALKVLTDRATANPVFRARFERECRLAAALEHPNVVPVYEAGESEGALFLSMRFVDGPNLSELLASEGRLPVDRVVGLVAQLAAALDAAHRAGLVHRDVKPANVLLETGRGRERVFLGDFGISRLLAGTAELTETGEMLGTVNYVAPEQIAGAAVDARADVYSLACVAYEALTGSPPFEQETQLATMFAHANAPRPKPSEARPGLPSGVDEVFARGLAVSPEDRYPYASEFAHALAAAIAGEPVAARAGGDRGARWWWAVIGAAIAVVAAVAVLAAAGVFSGSGGGPSERQGTAAVPGGVSAPAARADATVKVARDPVAVAVGALNIWTASASGHAVTAIVPATSDVARSPVTIDGRPVAIVVGFGSIWVVDQRGDALLRLDPAQGTEPVRIPVGGRPSDVAVSSSHLWVTNRADDTVSRIDPNTNQVDATATAGDAPASVSVGEGGVWVADSGSGTISVLDPVSARPRGKPVPVGGSPTSVAAGEAGVWVVDSARRQLLRVAPGSHEVSDGIDVGVGPTAVTTGFGYVWVALGEGSVRRVDPTQLLPAGDPIPVGQDPTAIAAGDNFVWTADTGDSTVTRIQPRVGRG